MIKYITVLDKDKIVLDLMGRKKTFNNDEEVHEDIYTKAYPQYFKRIGEIIGVKGFLTTPLFIADPIDDFLAKEIIRGEPKTIDKELPIEVKIDELAEAAGEFINDFDVKIETEEI